MNFFTKIKQFLTFSSEKPSTPKQERNYEIVTQGDENHHHFFVKASWDAQRLGSSVVSVGKDYGTPLEFPMITIKHFHRCICGAEATTTECSLI